MRTLVVGYNGGLGWEVMNEMDYISDVVAFNKSIISGIDISSFLANLRPFDFIVYCAGVNHIAKFDDISDDEFFDSMDINCFGFVRLIQLMRYSKKLNPNAIACIVTSNAANIPMTHSLSYNCSKAAANMMVRQMGRELRIEELTVFGVAPNKLKGTGMSKTIEKKVCEMRGWTPEQAEQYQLASLPARQETDPKDCATFIRNMIVTHGKTLHGTILPYGGPM